MEKKRFLRDNDLFLNTSEVEKELQYRGLTFKPAQLSYVLGAEFKIECLGTRSPASFTNPRSTRSTLYWNWGEISQKLPQILGSLKVAKPSKKGPAKLDSGLYLYRIEPA
jgi:hypothetical protein